MTTIQDTQTHDNASSIDWQKKREQLRQIEKALSLKERGPGPVVQTLFTILTATGAAILAYWNFYAQSEISLLNVGLLSTVVVLGAIIANKYSEVTTSYDDKLYALLAIYKPIDVEAYRQLQAADRNDPAKSAESIATWLYSERMAIDEAEGVASSARRQFLERDV